jgi:drug/metabolite transporter (DMT)-like permease
VNQRTTPILWCITAAALFGASTPASKALLAGIGPLALAGLLYLGAAIAVLPFSFRGGSPKLRRKRRNILMLLGAVVFGGGLGPVVMNTNTSMTRFSTPTATGMTTSTTVTSIPAFSRGSDILTNMSTQRRSMSTRTSRTFTIDTVTDGGPLRPVRDRADGNPGSAAARRDHD